MASETKLLSDLPGLGSVSLCQCGTVHLEVGAVILRLAPEAFLQMMTMCRDAMTELAVEMETPCAIQPSVLMH